MAGDAMPSILGTTYVYLATYSDLDIYVTEKKQFYILVYIYYLIWYIREREQINATVQTAKTETEKNI